MLNGNLQAQNLGLNLSYFGGAEHIQFNIIVAWLSTVPLQPPAFPWSASMKLETSTADQEKKCEEQEERG